MRALLLILAVDSLLVAAWVCYRLCAGIQNFSPAEVTPLLAIAGVLVALATLLYNSRKNASEDYLKSAVDLMSKAHDALDVKDKDGRPENDRLHWLTCARLIRTAEVVAGQITEPSHKRVWAEQLNYWRGKFYDLISPSGEGFPPEYFAEKPEHMYVYGSGDRDPLSEHSLAVLYRFVKWPEGVKDPLEGERSFSDEEIDKMRKFGPMGLGELLRKAREVAKKPR